MHSGENELPLLSLGSSQGFFLHSSILKGFVLAPWLAVSIVFCARPSFPKVYWGVKIIIPLQSMSSMRDYLFKLAFEKLFSCMPLCSGLV